MNVNAIATCAVQISRQRSERALEVGRTTGYVVPGIADFVSGRRIERQRIAIAVERSIQRHAGVDPVVECSFDYIGEFRISRSREHAPVPHHVADGGAAFTVSAEVWQLIGIPKSFAVGT